MRPLICFLLGLFLLPLSASASDDLGIPCSDKSGLARNIWDMVVYHDQLYVGCGDYTHNSGPVNVWTFSDNAGWISEFTVEEEQISRFRVLDDVLIIPGSDARESQDLGNWYERTPSGEWIKHRNVPRALHVWDIVDYDGLRFAALGARWDEQSIAISSDGGLTWTTEYVPFGTPPSTTCEESYIGRAQIVMVLFTVAGRLFADTGTYPRAACTDGVPRTQESFRFAQWDGTGFQPLLVNAFPGMRNSGCCILGSPIALGDFTFYIAQARTDFGFFRIDQSLNPQPISLANCSRPQDLELSDGVLYALCNESLGENWRISVSGTCDSEHWVEVFNVTAPTFARSFAVSGSKLYWSLGSDEDARASARAVTGSVYADQFHVPASCR